MRPLIRACRRRLLLTLVIVSLFAGPAAAEVYFIHADHLGTPRVISNLQQQAVWRATYEPFGTATVELATVTNNIRFPGQYFDAETGTHYNYYRDYDPSTGRYLQSDPIGLAGGVNTYAYVGGNPLRYTDQFGLRVSERFLPDRGLRIWVCVVTCPTFGGCGCPDSVTGLGFAGNQSAALSAAYDAVITKILPSGCRVPLPGIEIPNLCNEECRRNYSG